MTTKNFQVEKLRDDVSLSDLLDLDGQVFGGAPETTWNQLEYIKSYVRDLGCQSVLIESHYIDKDYIEDFSLFYSRSLHPYKNSCRRMHFFRLPAEELREYVLGLEGTSSESLGPEVSSASPYLGFVVVRPLDGSPVGRSVLQTVATHSDDSQPEIREFRAVYDYPVHLGLRELVVRGLPFQQQDVGVSACATVALWISMNQLRAFEDLRSPTPAQITTLATHFSDFFARPLPIETGLTVEQMCQALYALHVSPSLLVAESFDRAIGFVHYALRSRFSPILLLQDWQNQDRWHAVAVAGISRSRLSSPLQSEVVRRADEIVSLYVHDDRLGPYFRVGVRKSSNDKLLLSFGLPQGAEEWLVQYLLLPLHPKIHISVDTLDKIAIRCVGKVVDALSADDNANTRQGSGLAYDCWFERPHAFFRSLITEPRGPSIARRLAEEILLPRYLGIVRLEGDDLGKIDILVDSTSTLKNLHIVAACGRLHRNGTRAFNHLASELHCPAFVEPLADLA